MEAFLGLIGLGVIVWFVYALFNPEGAVYWHENPSRMKAFGYLLLGMFVIGSMNPNAEKSETGSEEVSETEIPEYKKASCNTRDARRFIEESYGNDTRVKGWAASYMMSNCRYYAKALIINPNGKPIYHKITIDGSSGEWTLVDQEVEKF